MKPELLLRRALHARGYRFPTNESLLPGQPDILLPNWRFVIEVRGSFWHRNGCCPKGPHWRLM